MCGISGYSLHEDSSIDPLQAARVLLASVAERGADASGCAYEVDGEIEVIKQPGGASLFLEQLEIPDNLRQILLHVRDHTKGRPSLPANNHPIRHGQIVGIHNGKLSNDEEIFARLKRDRAEPDMTVDSEAIFCLLDAIDNPATALEHVSGSLAIGWFDERDPGKVFLARGHGRPLWIATVCGEGMTKDIFWASTLEALEITEEFLRVPLRKRPVSPGTILEIAGGECLSTRSFEPDSTAQWLINPVASPEERKACLSRLDSQIA